MKLDTPTQTVLYTIEQAIKEYRRFCQVNILKQIKDITVDQVLLLIIIDKQPELSQKEIAELIFKDTASITRIIELMVKKDYLERSVNHPDRRRFNLKITPKGKNTIEKLTPTIEYNRRSALKGLTEVEIFQLYNTLNKIISNCNHKTIKENEK